MLLRKRGIDRQKLPTPHVVQHASTPQAPPPAGFRNGRPCSITYGQLAASNLPAFKGKTRVQQHQMVYQALKGRMGSELHALALQTTVRED